MNDPWPSDASLVARAVADGDRHAFGELVRRHQSAIRTLLRRLCAGDLARADDLAQETFLRAYIALADLAQPERFGPWVARIARNLALDWLRASVSRASFDYVPAESIDIRAHLLDGLSS